MDEFNIKISQNTKQKEFTIITACLASLLHNKVE